MVQQPASECIEYTGQILALQGSEEPANVNTTSFYTAVPRSLRQFIGDVTF